MDNDIIIDGEDRINNESKDFLDLEQKTLDLLDMSFINILTYYTLNRCHRNLVAHWFDLE